MERYNEYKDSGVQWLGEIPSHWEVVRNKFIFRESEERNSERRYQLLSFSKNRGIVPHAEINDKESSAEDLSKYKILHIGQLLENRLQAWNGMFSHSEIEGCVSPDYSVFSLIKDGVNIKYVSYLFRTPLYIEQWANASKGIGSGFNRLYTPQFNAIQCLIPPFEEQNRMVAYLDTITSKIDAAIAQQQKMIDLLNERKQIIINNAVTKGLNPNVKMKDSGVDWIGEIPEHWEVKKAKLCVTISNGSDPKTEGNIPVYGSGASSFRTCGEYKEGPCVLIGRKGATLHIPHYIQGRYWNVDTAFDVKTKNGIQLKYYYYLATCFDYPYYMSQTTLPSMTSFDYNRMKLPLPPEAEQKDIIDKLEQKLFVFDNAISSIEKQISLLQERKQIIINEVVTGKVKVC